MMQQDAMERLRWLVLREFRVLPGCECARQLSDGDILFAGVNMVLDMQLAGGETNPDFDGERFERMRGSEPV